VSGVDPTDLAELDRLDPPPTSVRDIKARMKWGTSKATALWSEWKRTRSRNVPEEHGNTAELHLVEEQGQGGGSSTG
jgi:hypothetical protein